MDLHHKMVLALLQKPDNGSDKLLKQGKSRTGGSYFIGTMILIGIKGESQDFAFDYMEQGQKRLVH